MALLVGACSTAPNTEPALISAGPEAVDSTHLSQKGQGAAGDDAAKTHTSELLQSHDNTGSVLAINERVEQHALEMPPSELSSRHDSPLTLNENPEPDVSDPSASATRSQTEYEASPDEPAASQPQDGDHVVPNVVPSGERHKDAGFNLDEDMTMDRDMDVELETVINAAPEPLAGESEEEFNIRFLDWTRQLVFEYVEGLNDGVDTFFMSTFFDDELIEDESSGSNGRIYFTTRRVINEGVDYKVGVNLRLVLPNTRDRMKLIVETDEEDDGQNETNLVDTTENVTYTTALRLEVREGRRWKTSWDNGVRWEGEPVYFSRLRSRREDHFGPWKSRIVNSLYWRTDDEWGNEISNYWRLPLGDLRSLNTGFEADYILKEDITSLYSDISLFDELSHRSAMLYRFAAIGDTYKYTKVENYSFSISYRRKIYKSFVFAEITPEIAWPRESNYRDTPIINFRLEMIIGPE